MKINHKFTLPINIDYDSKGFKNLTKATTTTKHKNEKVKQKIENEKTVLQI